MGSSAIDAEATRSHGSGRRKHKSRGCSWDTVLVLSQLWVASQRHTLQRFNDSRGKKPHLLCLSRYRFWLLAAVGRHSTAHTTCSTTHTTRYNECHADHARATSSLPVVYPFGACPFAPSSLDSAAQCPPLPERGRAQNALQLSLSLSCLHVESVRVALANVTVSVTVNVTSL